MDSKRDSRQFYNTFSGIYVILVFLDIAILTITIIGIRVCDSKGLRMKCTRICEGERGGERDCIMWNFRHVLFTKYYIVQEIKENDVCGSHIICGDDQVQF
jgi:hypothetical protein